MKRVIYFVGSILFFVLGCKPSFPEGVELAYEQLPDQVDFNGHVRAILSDRCWKCHGPDEAARKGNLRLDNPEFAFAALSEGPGYALVGGSLNKSQVFHRITTDDPELMMPPRESNLVLNDKEKATLIKWIEQGAEWKDHWSFIPPVKSEVPKIKEATWTQHNDIDHFVQVKLLDYGLKPSSKADKERLLRRVFMDLTGLPPSIPEMDAFLSDDSENAFEKVVDKLLQSNAYGERMAMEWMDLSRYADSHGMHADGLRIMWPWRDWVIESFKNNRPYDEFVTWQIAGDLFPNATREQKLATAFLRNHPMTAEGGAVDEEFRLEYVFDRTNTVSTAFLGLTMECARCHDHKFDPFSQDEYYQLAGFFNNVKELGMTGDDGNYGPMILLPDETIEEKLKAIEVAIEKKENEINISKTEIAGIKSFISSLSNIKPTEPEGRIGYFPFDQVGDFIDKDKNKKTYFDGNKKCTSSGTPILLDGHKGMALNLPTDYDEVYLSDIGTFESNESFTISSWIFTTEHNPEKTQVILGNAGDKNNFWRGWDFYLDESNQPNVRLIHSLPHNYIHLRSEKKIPLNTWTQVAFSYDGSSKAQGLKLFINGEKENGVIAFDNLYKSIHPIKSGNHERNNTPLRVGKSYRAFTGESGLFKGRIDEIKVYNRALTSLEIQWASDIEKEVEEVNKIDYKIAHHPTIKKQTNELGKLHGEQLALKNDIMEVMVMEEMHPPRPMHVLNRGVYDQPLHEVNTAPPGKVLDYPEHFAKNRIGLAKWMFKKENPLTARVAVNRYWQLIFGRGIVNTPQDFGSQGALPSHPELLDYLAVKFQESNWDLRTLIKEMVMSYTYQQSSNASTEQREKDPQNIWLACSPSYRLPAEMIRDNALASSGLLVANVGGESVKPYQPEGLWIDLGNFSHALLNYKEDEGEKLYHRSMYTFIRRTSPPPFMTTFDMPSRDRCTVQREQTNTPLQALNLLNDPQFVEAARVLAVNMQKMGGPELSDQIEYAFRRVTGRRPMKKEVAILTELFHGEKERFKNSPGEAKKILSIGNYPPDKSFDKVYTAALAVVANTILNHDEAYMKR